MVLENPLKVRRLLDNKSSRWGMTRPRWLSKQRIGNHWDNRTHSLRWHSSWRERSNGCQTRRRSMIQVPSGLLDSSKGCSHISALPHSRNILGYKPRNEQLGPSCRPMNYDLSGVLSENLEAGGRGLPGCPALSVTECHGLATVGGVQHSGRHL